MQEIQRGTEGKKEGRGREGKLWYSYKEMILTFHATSSYWMLTKYQALYSTTSSMNRVETKYSQDCYSLE